MTGATVPLGFYLWKRLQSLGIEHVFGVPGDFNLTLLDQIYDVPELTWLGNCNELNAAYAADGYTRIKGVPAALVTTYAVGELSAMNGVAGAYAEHAGMIHIVGMTARPMQKARTMMHHTMEPNMDHTVYVAMSKPVRKTYALLIDDATMAEEIDRVIAASVTSRLPVFIYVPTDVVNVPLDASRLKTPLETTIKNNKQEEDLVVERVLEMIKDASNPAILADVLTTRHGGLNLIRRLADLTQFPCFSTPLSKGIIDEDKPYYNGVYNGKVSFPGVQEALESSDLVLNLGFLLSDSNTGGFSRNIGEQNLVLLGCDFCQIREEKIDDLHFLPILERIVSELEAHPQAYHLPRPQSFTRVTPPLLNPSKSGPITQSYIWQRLSCFLRPDDILIAEVGTAQFGMPDATFPPNTSYITQMFWSSIGYSVGGCLGACVAARELNPQNPRRVVLIVGEGSLQMSVQELSTIIKCGFRPTIFVINNGGYSIERAINGPKSSYNDVSMLWDHQRMLEFFGARKECGVKSLSWRCATVEELEGLLDGGRFGNGECIQLCEVMMDKFDYPWRLHAQIVHTKAKIREGMKVLPYGPQKGHQNGRV